MFQFGKQLSLVRQGVQIVRIILEPSVQQSQGFRVLVVIEMERQHGVKAPEGVHVGL